MDELIVLGNTVFVPVAIELKEAIIPMKLLLISSVLREMVVWLRAIPEMVSK